MRSAVVLLSGGIDSATLAYDLSAMGVKVEGLLVNYGQRTIIGERRAATYLAHVLNIPLTELDVPLPTSISAGALFDAHAPLDWQTPLVSFLPQRNLLLLTLASMFAQAHGVKEVAIGLIDSGGEYPDATAAFCQHAEQVLRLCYPDVQIRAPYVAETKAQVVNRAKELGVPLQATFSCHFEPDRHCGRCPACAERFRVMK